MPWIQPAHKISQIPCTSHLFLPCWVHKYVGQGASLSGTGETEVMDINTGSRLAGVGQEVWRGQSQPGKPCPWGPACSPISFRAHKKTEAQRGRGRGWPQVTWAARVRGEPGAQAPGFEKRLLLMPPPAPSQVPLPSPWGSDWPRPI